MARPRRDNRLPGVLAGWSAVALTAAVLAGCQKPLFPANQPRNQFDRFDRVRNQAAAEYVDDEFGRRRPNLSGRLSPKTR